MPHPNPRAARSKRRIASGSISVLVIALGPFAALAQETPLGGLEPGPRAGEAAEEAREALPETYPRLSYGIAVEAQNDYTFEADDEASELNDLSPTVEGAFALELNEGTGIYSSLVMEPVFDAVSDDREFGDVGLFVEELFLAASFGDFEVKGGKFNPTFAMAFDTAPGVFGTDFAEDLELTERIGVGAGFSFEALGGEHELSTALFLADRTFLSDSIFDERGDLDRDDGGASNTGGLESFSIASDGEIGPLTYHGGARFQTGGRGAPSDEVGFVFGLGYADIDMGPGDLELLAEAGYLNNADGELADVFLGTIGAAFVVDPFTLSAVYSLRDTSGDDGSTDHLLTASVEYEILDGLTGAVGYAYERAEREDAHTIGLLLAFEFGGGVSF